MEISWAQTQWNEVVEFFGNDRFNIIVWGTFLVSFCSYWGFGLLFTYVDLTGKPKFMWKYKIQDNVKSYPISKEQFVDLLKILFINQSVIIPCLMIAYYVDKWGPVTTIHALPTISTAMTHIFFYMIAIEITFYYAHRMLHLPFFYKRIHKKHHTWISPIAIAATYCHPIEQIISNIIPTLIGPFILSSHILVQWIWLMIATVTTLVTHSGYHIPFLVSSEAHDFHHLKFNYNFGVLGILDYFHGTDGIFRNSKQATRHRTLWSFTPAKILFP